MTAAAKSELFARTEVQQFVGYALWGVWLTTRSTQHWDDSVKTYGRSDTVEQAWGMVAAVVNDLPLDCLRCDGGMWSWRDARTAIRQRGEERRMEGSLAWLEYSTEQKAAFHEAGIRFMQNYSMHNRAHWRLSRALPWQCLKVLGLESGVHDLAEIKKAYRRLAAQHHPDRGGNSQHFIIIRQAYEQLTKSF